MQPTLGPPRLDCGGPHRCTVCALEAHRADAESVGRLGVAISVGARPDDVDRLMAMLRVVGQFGHRLGRVCDDCVEALEQLVSPPAGDGVGDEDAQQRADDDGWSPTD